MIVTDKSEVCIFRPLFDNIVSVLDDSPYPCLLLQVRSKVEMLLAFNLVVHLYHSYQELS